ncbi:MAG: aldo/keto reductase [Phycisphaerae bacterium]|nr:aldo/keto reductase [Phycisphaerae bacterium]
MEMTELGRTGIRVSRLCIGCWQAAGWETSDDERFMRTLAHALDRGLNFLDTAPAYGRGHSEELVGKVIAGRREKVVVATKLSASTTKPEKVREGLENSLRRLGTDYIDLYQQHWPQREEKMEETVALLERFKQEGKIRAIGVSNWMELEWRELADPSRVDCLQPCHSLLWRSIEKSVLPMCREHRIAVIPYSSLCQGILAGKFRSLDRVPTDSRERNRRLDAKGFPEVLRVVAALEEVADKYGKSLTQTALRWLLDQEGVTAPIVGASRPEQVDDNIGALGWRLATEDWQRLSEVSWPLSAELGPTDTLWTWHPRYSEKKG